MTTPYIDPKNIFASNAPTQDRPPRFDNYDKGMDETRKNNGRPTIKQLNYLHQQTDLKILYIHENGAGLPYVAGIDYQEGALILKDGELVQKSGDDWVSIKTQNASELSTANTQTQQEINDSVGAKWYAKEGGYAINARVMLDNGDIVRNTVANNTNNPNSDMTGWVFSNKINVFDNLESMLSSAQENNQIVYLSSINTVSDIKEQRGGGYFVFLKNQFYFYDDGGIYFSNSTGTFKRILDGQDKYNSDWWGCVGDGITDDADSLQKAIDAAIKDKRPLVTPYGIYSISKPLLIAQRNGFNFTGAVSLTWSGEGSHIWSASNTTRILPTFKDTFAIGIQRARGVILERIQCYGKNPVQEFIYAASNANDRLNINNYNLDGCRDTRYSPYCGIVIDPFHTSLPSDGGYPNLSGYYNSTAGKSSSIIFREVSVKNFIGGVAVCPNGDGNNASEIEFFACQITFNKSALITCHAQSRNMFVYGGEIGGSYYAFDGLTYGLQRGFAPHVFGCNVGGSKYLYHVRTGEGEAPAKAVGLHCESFYALGFIGEAASSGAEPAVFQDCRFNMGFATTSRATDAFLVSYAPVLFNGCTFAYSAGATNYLSMYQNAGDINFDFNTCAVSTAGGGSEFTAYFGEPTSYKVNFLGSFTPISRNRPNGKSLLTQRLYYPTNNIANGTVAVDGMQFQKSDTQTTLYRTIGNHREAPLATGSVIVNSDNSASITFPAGTGIKLRIGDMLVNTSSTEYESIRNTKVVSNRRVIGVVSAITGDVVTVGRIAESIVNGDYVFRVAWWPKFHIPTTGDTTNGSNTILNVANASAWTVGDRISGGGIPELSYVTAVSGTTLTISQNATAGVNQQRLYDAIITSLTSVLV